MKLPVVVGFLVALSAPRVASANADSCAGWLDRIEGYIVAIEKLVPDPQAAVKVREHTTDIDSGVEQAALCIGKLPVSAERTQLERRYQDMQKSAPVRIKQNLAQLNQAIELRNESVAVRKQINAAPLGSDQTATVAAFSTKLAGIKGNRYVTPAWKAALLATFESSLERHAKARVNAAASAELARLEANTVVTRHDGKFTADDASRQLKIVEAFELASAADLVTAGKNTARYVPVAAEETYRQDENPQRYHNDTSTELAFTDSDSRVVQIRLRDKLPPFPAGVPALVWDIVEPGVVVVVTIDGGRYVVGAHRLRAGTSPEDEWPAQPIHTTLIDRDIAALALIGAVDPKQARAVKTTQDSYNKCAEGLWARNQSGFEAIRVSNITSSTRTNRLDALDTKVRKSIEASCGKHETAFDKAWRSVVAGYVKSRAQTLAENRARLQKL